MVGPRLWLCLLLRSARLCLGRTKRLPFLNAPALALRVDRVFFVPVQKRRGSKGNDGDCDVHCFGVCSRMQTWAPFFDCSCAILIAVLSLLFRVRLPLCLFCAYLVCLSVRCCSEDFCRLFVPPVISNCFFVLRGHFGPFSVASLGQSADSQVQTLPFPIGMDRALKARKARRAAPLYHSRLLRVRLHAKSRFDVPSPESTTTCPYQSQTSERISNLFSFFFLYTSNSLPLLLLCICTQFSSTIQYLLLWPFFSCFFFTP